MDGQKDGRTDRQTDRYTDRQTQSDRQTDVYAVDNIDVITILYPSNLI